MEDLVRRNMLAKKRSSIFSNANVSRKRSTSSAIIRSCPSEARAVVPNPHPKGPILIDQLMYDLVHEPFRSSTVVQVRRVAAGAKAAFMPRGHGINPVIRVEANKGAGRTQLRSAPRPAVTEMAVTRSQSAELRRRQQQATATRQATPAQEEQPSVREVLDLTTPSVSSAPADRVKCGWNRIHLQIIWSGPPLRSTKTRLQKISLQETWRITGRTVLNQ